MKYQTAAAISSTTGMIHRESAIPPVDAGAGAGPGVVVWARTDKEVSMKSTSIESGVRRMYYPR
jgi:hypothetical protein